MNDLESTLSKAVPGGSIAKPLMLALLALLASGSLFKSGGTPSPGSTPSPSVKPPQAPPNPSDGSGGGLLGGLGGLLDKLQKGGLGNATNSWVGPGQNQPVSPGQLGPALGPDILKTLAQRSGLSEEELLRQLSQALPGIVDKLTPHGRMPTLAELSQL
jgi:uncharacterized protein YidB (DUF937 family)